MKKYAIPNYVGLKKLFRIMQLSTIFCVLTIFELAASNIVYSQPVNSFDMNLKNVEVQTVLKEISQKSTFDFFYNSTLLDNLPKVNVKVRNAEVGEILDEVIPLHLLYELVDETIIIKKKPETELKKSSAFINVDQERTITGTVLDENNEGLPGVNVVVTGTTIGTITAVDGKYTLSIPEQGTSIQFSAIGYSSQEIQIGSRSIVDVTLTVNVEELDEIVVTALGIRSQKKSLGYATQNISAESITRGKETNIAKDIERCLIEKGVSNYKNISAKTSINELISKIANLDLFITGDSGPMHIAAAFKIPTVAIFGPTEDKETSQWMNEKSLIVKKNLECQPCMKRKCPLKHHNCMKSIKSIDVLDAVNSII